MKIKWIELLERQNKREVKTIAFFTVFILAVWTIFFFLIIFTPAIEASERLPFIEMDFLDARNIRQHLINEHGYIFHPDGKSLREALKAACIATDPGSAPIGWRQNGTGAPVAVCLVLRTPTETEAIHWCAKHKAIIMLRAKAVGTCRRSIR